jgi:putative ATPase
LTWARAHATITAITFPAISTGIFGFPKERAAGVIQVAIPDYFTQIPGVGIRQVRLTLFDHPMVGTFSHAWQAIAQEFQSQE